MSPFPFLHPLVLELILSRIVPWTLEAAGDDILAAQDAAIALLHAFDPANEQEALLAAETICFQLGSLETLAKSVSPGLSVATVLRMRGNANTLNRSAHRAQAKLAALRKLRGARPVDARSAAAEPDPAQQQKRPLRDRADGKAPLRQERERWEAGRTRRPVRTGGRQPGPVAVTPTHIPRRKAA